MALDFCPDGRTQINHDIQPQNLHAHLGQQKRACTDYNDEQLSGRILIIEDITPELVEILGASLNIDPFFFASHVHAPLMEATLQTPEEVSLPSYAKHQHFVNMHYHAPIELEGLPCLTQGLVHMANVHRKIAVLPSAYTNQNNQSSRIALAQHCCSIIKVEHNVQEGWLCVVLTDPPIVGELLSLPDGTDAVVSPGASIRIKDFLGGYEAFTQQSQSFADYQASLCCPRRESILDDLIHYWASKTAANSLCSNPSLLSLSYHPFRIVAAQWNNYRAVMRRSLKRYEYSVKSIRGIPHELEHANADLYQLQCWRRRTMSARYKIQAAAQCIRWQGACISEHGSAEVDWESLAEDYDRIDARVGEVGKLLENMLPVVTSLIQLIDSRRAYAETVNIKKLTSLAFLFGPLTFVSTVFNMTGHFAPGQRFFWVYFAFAIPLTILVSLFAYRPVLSELIMRAIRRLRNEAENSVVAFNVV